MKTKTPIPELIMPDALNDIPLRLQAVALSNLIEEQLDDAILDGSISITEMAGLLGMGVCLRDYCDGKIKGLMAHSFMRTLAEKKTPAPIAKSENVTHLDIANSLAEIVNNNPDALARTNALADERRIQIQQKLHTDNLLMLRKADVEKISGDEPDEIKRLRESNG